MKKTVLAYSTPDKLFLKNDVLYYKPGIVDTKTKTLLVSVDGKTRIAQLADGKPVDYVTKTAYSNDIVMGTVFEQHRDPRRC